MTTIGAEQLTSAWTHCVNGKFTEALAILTDLLRRSPDAVDAWVMLAKLQFQQRRHDQALIAASTATKIRPAHADAWYTLGRVHRATGAADAAEACYRRAIAAGPASPDMLTSLGVLLRARGRTDEAIALYRRALALDPHHAEAANNLGNALAAVGAAAEARQLHDRGKPVLAAKLLALRAAATGLASQGNATDALAALYEALRISPQSADLWLTAGKLASALGLEQVGLEHIEEAVRLDPGCYEAVEIARRICVAGGLYERAVRYSERAQQLLPSVDADIALKLLLPCVQQSIGTIRATRLRYERGLDEILESSTRIDTPPDATGNTSFFLASHCAFFLAYHGENDRDLQVKLAQMYLKTMPGLAMTASHCNRARPPAGRVRIGFISRFLSNHSIGKTTRGLIAQLSRDNFEVIALRITPADDDGTTRMIRESADRTIDLDPNWLVARDEIAALELDVLFYQDIGMEPTSYFLAFARLAPVQCVSFGHPNTTGIANMDYFVSNDLYETPGSQAHYSERLFLLRGLPTLAYYYKPAPSTALPNRERFGFSTQETLYLCPQTLFKLHPDFDALIRGILTRDHNGILVLIEGQFKEFGEQVRARFERSVPELTHRIRFVPRMPYSLFLELLAAADVILDTVHFNGMNTSLESLALGTPVVTLPTDLQRGRHTQAMYRTMGLMECVASSPEEYVEIAVRLGTDRPYALEIRERIRALNHVLYEDRRVIDEFERFFLETVRASNGASTST
jgi:protein O-GlcNAc transferase